LYHYTVVATSAPPGQLGAVKRIMEEHDYEVRTFARVVDDMFPSCHAQAGTNARCSSTCAKAGPGTGLHGR
jgi:hypothetical protein